MAFGITLTVLIILLGISVILAVVGAVILGIKWLSRPRKAGTGETTATPAAANTTADAPTAEQQSTTSPPPKPE